MPNFTEGEWQYAIWKCRNNVEYWNIYRITDNNVDCIALDIRSEADARLMAQSKKMYEALKQISNRRWVSVYGDCLELCGSSNGVDGNDWMQKVDAVLSEIDKE